MSTRPLALLDSNVVIAAVAIDHEHNAPSAALLAQVGDWRLAIPAHGFTEAYSTLTRPRPRGFGQPPADVWDVLTSLAAATRLVGLSPPQTFEATGRYAAAGGIGPRLYDHLIGAVAVQHGIGRIVTWNVRHMRGLFPMLDVVDPVAALAG